MIVSLKCIIPPRRSNSVVFLLLALILVLHSGCDSNEPEVEGYWELEKLVIDNIDTTESVKSDTNCYGYTYFYIREETKEHVMVNIQFYNVAGFNCMDRGYYFHIGKILRLDYLGFPKNVGPYLSGDEVEWTVLELSQERLHLETTYQGMLCYLTFKRKQ